MTKIRSILEVVTSIGHDKINNQLKNKAMSIRAKKPIHKPQVSFGLASKPTNKINVMTIGVTHLGKACRRTNSGELILATIFWKLDTIYLTSILITFI
jgi:hypothetical protein